MNRMAVSTTLEIEKVFKLTMDRIRTIFDVEAGLLYLKEKEKLKTTITFNTQKESIQQFRQKIGSRIAGIVVSKGKPLIVNDTQKSSLPSANTTQQKVLNTRAILCVPLITQAKALGAIELISRANVGFSGVDDTLLNSIAAALSPTLLLCKR
jgi:GAF domain-containing protein